MHWFDYLAMAFLFACLVVCFDGLGRLAGKFNRFLEVYFERRRGHEREVEALRSRVAELEASSPYVRERHEVH